MKDQALVEPTQKIKAAFPFTSRYIDVLGSRMHYVDEGEGKPILFLHGLPASSYVWRNMIPSLKRKGRCIAVDLIGLGKSDKPEIEYTLADHIRYMDAFIQALQLKDVTLVMHGWGSLIGFDYAMRHEKNVRGLAFMEAFLLPPHSQDQISLAVLELSSVLEQEDGGYDAIVHKNYYLNVELPSLNLRKLSKEELAHYHAPFVKEKDCKPLWKYAQEFPMVEENQHPASVAVHARMEKIVQWLQKTSLPKLMMYAVPGYLTTIATVKWARDHLSHLMLADVGDALHYPQESDPVLVSEKLQNWYLTL